MLSTDLLIYLTGLITRTQWTKWWICDSSWWLVWSRFISTLSSWDSKYHASLHCLPQEYSFVMINFELLPESWFIWFIAFLVMMKVIYAGLVVASGGTDPTIWLLFGFVVRFFFCTENIIYINMHTDECSHAHARTRENKSPHTHERPMSSIVTLLFHWGIFQVSNLVFAAAETHRWYLKKFKNYPSNRLAIIPFVY